MRREWTDKEVAYLEKFYEKKGVDYIATKLERTPNSIKRKAQRLGYNAYIIEDLYVRTIAKCFNCDSRVINRWIDNYGLPYRIVERGQTICKLISVRQFWKWAKDHEDLIPWSKYERFSILPEPEWIDKIIKNYTAKNNRKRITQAEIQHVIWLRKQGKSFKEIALEMNRTIDSVKHIWKKEKENI